MIKNTHKAVTDYTDACRQANEIYRQTVKHIRTNYKEGSELYVSAMKTAQDAFETALQPMQNTFKDIVKKDFETVRKQIKGAVGASPSAEVLGILPLISSGKMNETEVQIFLDLHKANYMDTKLIHDAMGKHFVTVENIMDQVDSVELYVNNYFKTYTGESLDKMSYQNALTLNGSIIDELDELTDDFVTAYGGECKN